MFTEFSSVLGVGVAKELKKLLTTENTAFLVVGLGETVGETKKFVTLGNFSLFVLIDLIDFYAEGITRGCE